MSTISTHRWRHFCDSNPRIQCSPAYIWPHLFLALSSIHPIQIGSPPSASVCLKTKRTEINVCIKGQLITGRVVRAFAVAVEVVDSSLCSTKPKALKLGLIVSSLNAQHWEDTARNWMARWQGCARTHTHTHTHTHEHYQHCILICILSTQVWFGTAYKQWKSVHVCMYVHVLWKLNPRSHVCDGFWHISFIHGRIERWNTQTPIIIPVDLTFHFSKS